MPDNDKTNANADNNTNNAGSLKITDATCRFCDTPLNHTFVDLGMSPLCQTRINKEDLNRMEAFFPLHAYVCEKCFLVQIEEYVAPQEIFSDYAYFSSYSDSWLDHCARYVDMIERRLDLNKNSFVVELASNDGYLLKNFVSKSIPVLGIEPADNVAKVAIENGVNTISRFFGVETASDVVGESGNADLIIGNNVLAHVPDINDFVGGMKRLLAENGSITMEFPHLFQLIRHNQFDTIYHEHFSYLSFYSVNQVFTHHGLKLYDVEKLPTHGGSIRIYACHKENSMEVTENAKNMQQWEERQGVTNLETYQVFSENVKQTKRKILQFLINAKNDGKRIVGYGAPGKGNTLLNYCGIRTDFLDFTVDRSPHKQNTFTPGTHIPIYHPDLIKEVKPDYVFILPWNLKDEIISQLEYIREWGGKFIVPIPEPTVM